jgi:hypothetical protein
MTKKGTLYLEGKNIIEFKSKNVELQTNIEKTKHKWTNFLNNKF